MVEVQNQLDLELNLNHDFISVLHYNLGSSKYFEWNHCPH